MIIIAVKKFICILALVFISGLYHAALAQEPEKRAITIEDLATIRDIKTMSVSPGGQHIAYQIGQPDVESNSYAFSWLVAPTSPTGRTSVEPRFIADGGDLIFNFGELGSGINGEFSASPPRWSPDSKRFAYLLKNDGEVQIWLSHVDKAGQKRLTRNEADIRHFEWSDDGRSILYSVGRSRSDNDRLDRRARESGYLVKADVFATSIDMPAPPPCRTDDSLDDFGDALGLTDDDQTCFVTIWKYDFAQKKEIVAGADDIKTFELLTARDREQRERYSLSSDVRFMLTLSSDGKRSAWAENIDPDVYQGSRPPQKIAATTENGAAVCNNPDCQSSHFIDLWWRKNSPELYFLANTGPKRSLTSLRKWNPNTGEVKTIIETDDKYSDCHFLQTHVVCAAESWTTPSRVVSINLASGGVTILLDPNPAFRKIQFTKIEKLVWKDAFGNTALAHLVYPKNYQEGQAYPMVVTTYRSRGFLRGAMGDEQPIHVLAQHGFFVLSYDVPENEESFHKEEDYVRRAKAAFSFELFERGSLKALNTTLGRLEERGLIDPERVGITAFSYGYNLLQVALVNSDHFAAASTAWLPDERTIGHFRPQSALKIAEAVFGDEFYDEDSELWRKISVSVNADKIDVPILFQVADREYFGTLPTFIALKDAQKPVEMYRFHDEHHVKWQPAHRFAIYERNIDWFNFWLRNYEDADPRKDVQYERWQKLREQHIANLKSAGKDYSLPRWSVESNGLD